MKRWFFLGVFIVLVSSLVVAQTSSFDEEKSYSWLKTKIGNWETNDVNVIAFVMLAMINHGDDVSGGVSKLRSLEHATHCWPNSGCKVLDTALASLALYKSGENVGGGIAWLENQDGALNPALSADKWELEIISDGSGSCTLTYGSQVKTVKIENGMIDGKWSLKLSELSGLNLNNKASANIDINCVDLPLVTIALTYRPSNTIFYRLVNEQTSSLDLKIANGCYGTTLTSGGCDYLTTAYTSWALSEMDREIITNAYLESQIPTGGILENAIIGRITGKSNYMKFLVEKQRPIDGSWEAGNIYKTAWASFTLSKEVSASEAYNSGLKYLENMVSPAGHWNNNAKDTAMALIAIHGSELTELVPSVIIPPTTCTTDEDCASGEICNTTTSLCEAAPGLVEICDNYLDDDNDGLIDCDDIDDCASDPACVEGVECTYDSACEYGYICSNGECIVSEDGVVGCNEDGMCDYGEGCDCSDCAGEDECAGAAGAEGCTDDEDCDEGEKCKDGDCVEKKGLSWWILGIIVLIIIIGVGGWFLVSSGKLKLEGLFKKKPPKRPSFMEYTRTRPIQPGYMPPPRAQPSAPKKTKEDIELERSLREAEKLLHGK